MTTSPNLGIMHSAQISMILYCIDQQRVLEGLFLTGFLPGMPSCFSPASHVLRSERKNKDPQGSSTGSQALWATFKSLLALMLPV